MPHVIVKLHSGRTDEQKRRIAEAVTRAMIDTAGSSEAAISVGIEDVAPESWTAAVFEPDIRAKPDTIFKKPGYDPK